MFHLETERLIVRPWQPSDRSAFTAMARDPEVMRYVHRGEPYTEEEIDGFMARQAKNLADTGVCMGAMVDQHTLRPLKDQL